MVPETALSRCKVSTGWQFVNLKAPISHYYNVIYAVSGSAVILVDAHRKVG